MSDLWASVEAIDATVKSNNLHIDQTDRFFIILEARSEDQAADLPAKVGAYLKSETTVEPLFEQGGDLGHFVRLLFLNIDRRTVRTIAFQLSHDLRERFDLISAEPVVEAPFFPIPDDPATALTAEQAIIKRSCEVTDVNPPSEKRWATLMIKAPDAIDYARAKGKPAGGEGARVAQPDTGYREVHELSAIAVDQSKGWNAIKGVADATDPIDYKGHPGHGTATGSCVVSREDGDMTGSAPNAILYPIRCINNVIVLQPDTVARAIAHACRPELKIDVITMSLGGVPSRAVRAAIRLAVRSDIVILAAAGNCVRLVVWPARYSECIAVAGCNISGKSWKGSSRGSAVDITAPGEMVWHGTVKPGLTSDDGQGTSFAVALTAGAAAQWVAFHSREAIKDEARKRGVFAQDLFRAAAQATAQAAPDLDDDDYGPGIINIEALLRLDLDKIPVIAKPIRFDQDDVGDNVPADYREIFNHFAQGNVESAAGFDWDAFGGELGYVALDRAVLATTMNASLEATPDVAISPALAAATLATPSTALKAWAGVDTTP